MQRFLAFVLAVAACTIALPKASAEAVAERCEEGIGGHVVCTIGDEIVKRGRPGQPRWWGRGVAGPDPKDVVYWPDTVLRPDGSRCVRLQRVMAPNASDRDVQGQHIFVQLLRSYPPCERSAVPPVNPTFVARRFVEELTLPAPRPHIAPGYAVTGMRSYLETRGDLRPRPFTATTPLGPIEVTAVAHYLVDWGDGTPAERFEVEGGPWPEGRITHTYAHTGTYDVVVTAVWTAAWRVGSTEGSFTDLRTQGRIEDFEARQVQAVRNR